MQREINEAHTAHAVQFLGVNQVGQESGNDLVCQGRVIPWLQETPDHLCWGPWAVRYRDVVLVDTEGRRIGSYNLTDHNLADPGNYDLLKEIVLKASNR
jgi:hypothetical protein